MKALYGSLMAVLLAASVAAQDAPADLQQRAAQANGSDCARLNMQVARETLEEAKRLFGSGDLKAAHKEIDVSLGYVGHSVDCSLQARKREKATEIDLRRLIDRMKEVLHTLDTEDRPHISHSLAQLEEQRDRLLQAIFGAAAGGGAPEKKP